VPNWRRLQLRCDISGMRRRGRKRPYHHHGGDLRTVEFPHGVICQSSRRSGPGPRIERICMVFISHLQPQLKSCRSSPIPSLASMELVSFHTAKHLQLFSWKGTPGHLQTEDYVPDRLGQVDFLRFVFTRPPSMACAYHATVTRSLGRCRNWPLHCVRDVLFVCTLPLITCLQFHWTLYAILSSPEMYL
jgi:hypothetical protein